MASEDKKPGDGEPTVSSDARATLGVELSGPIAIGNVIGPYTLLERLGEGGMGVVFTAWHRDLNRKVALKLLRAEGAGSIGAAEAQLRLLREAQAMARLDHPNVVAVHDAGSHQNRVYLAMDRVEGSTLRLWLKERPRSWREILSAFVEAGSGLAAAHAAGLVHRDFKPSNVLVGTDGRVRVTDFGLARAVGVEADPVGAPLPANEVLTDLGALATPITRIGTVVGTPHYMAPEQKMGASGDPRSDQYSFCLALHEALHGPVPAPEQSSVPGASSPPRSRGVPSRVDRAIRRGMSTAPQDRFESMNALLAELSSAGLKRRGRRSLIAAGVVVLLGAGVAVAVAASRAPELAGCEHSGRELTGLWDGDVRRRVGDAMRATGRPRAAGDADALVASLDRYAATWQVAHQEGCARAKASMGDATALSELVCLGRQRMELQGLIGVLLQADADSEPNAMGSAAGLTPPQRCADPRALASMPGSPAEPRLRADVDAFRLALAAGRARHSAGKIAQALPELQAISARADVLGYRPLQAEALLELGTAQADEGRANDAEQSLTRAESMAEAAGADGVAVRAATELVFVIGSQAGRPVDARPWIARARILLDRTGGDPLLEGKLEAALAAAESDPELALAHQEKAVAAEERALGPTNQTTLRARGALAIDYMMVDRYAEARTLARRTITDVEQILGAEHWDLGVLLGTVAASEIELGELDAADADLAREGVVLERAGGPRGTYYGLWQQLLSALRLEQGRGAEALTLAERAQATFDEASGPGNLGAAFAMSQRGEALVALSRPREAMEPLEAAQAKLTKSSGADSPETADVSVTLARAEIEGGHPERALPRLEQAVPILERHPARLRLLCRAHFALARALVATGGDSARAAQFARTALNEYGALPWKKEDTAQLQAWMQANRIR